MRTFERFRLWRIRWFGSSEVMEQPNSRTVEPSNVLQGGR